MFDISTIINIIWKGFLIGVIASAPMGPVGVLCLQRTLNKGLWYGVVTGAGAALSDLLYALLTGFGMSFIFDYVNKNVFYLQLFGSILLFFFGMYTFRSNPARSIRRPDEDASAQKGGFRNQFLTAFLVTFSNPLIIFLFIGLFARFSFVEPGALVSETFTGYLSMTIGAMSWWFGLSFVVNKVRKRFNLRGIWIINRTIGSVVMIVSAIALLLTFTGRSFY